MPYIDIAMAPCHIDFQTIGVQPTITITPDIGHPVSQSCA
jgi:hypothetical protein